MSIHEGYKVRLARDVKQALLGRQPSFSVSFHIFISGFYIFELSCFVGNCDVFIAFSQYVIV